MRDSSATADSRCIANNGRVQCRGNGKRYQRNFDMPLTGLRLRPLTADRKAIRLAKFLTDLTNSSKRFSAVH